MSDRDELAALVGGRWDFWVDDPTRDREGFIGDTVSGILARWRLVPIPKGHVREQIDPRRDIDARGPVKCTKCGAVVGWYQIAEPEAHYPTVSYGHAWTSPPPCIA